MRSASSSAWPLLLVAAAITACAPRVRDPASADAAGSVRAGGLPHPIVGTWQLVTYERREADGSVTHPMGDPPLGLVTYDASGTMAVQIGYPDRARRPWPPAVPPSPEPLGYLAYFGTYSLTARGDSVTHHIQGSVLPQWVGASFVRGVELQGDRLVLRRRGEREEDVLTWTRVRPEIARLPQEPRER